MKQVTKKVFQTDDGAIFNTVQEAHDYLDQTYRTALELVAKEINKDSGIKYIAHVLDVQMDNLEEARSILIDKIIEPMEPMENPFGRTTCDET